MKKRKLRNLEVSAIGMGCMGFSTGYGEIPTENESIRLIRLSHELGCTLYDTAEVYAVFRNENLVGKALEPIRNEIILSSKFSPTPLPGQNLSEGKLTKSGLHKTLEDSLKRLRTDHLDIYFVHRMTDEIEIEELAEWFGELIKEGKILGWGLSEVDEKIIRRANSVTPLTAIESEYSMMARQWEQNEISTCEELGIGFMAYSPMAGGLLSGKIQSNTEFKGDDIRRTITRYSKENLDKNQPVIDLVKKFAAEKNATPAQISLAWVMHKPFIVPIPGMRKDERIRENLGAAEVILTDAEYKQLTDELNKLKIYGDRKDEDIAKLGDLVRNKLFGSSGVPIKGLDGRVGKLQK
ncbi:MAG: aldo/keto reductase [Selenomonadaceae bacterium]|nr:aldo/keto reductase [Selenomonadaceae bacterium]